MKLVRDYISLVSGFGLQIIAVWLEWLDAVELITLQKVFYLLSIVLICIGIVQVLFKQTLPRGRKVVEAIANTQQAKKIVELADDPESKGSLIVKTFQHLKKGGQKMKKFITDRGPLKVASLVATVLLLALGITSAFVPELAVVGQNIEVYLVTVGLSAIPGIFSNGKVIGNIAKDVLPSKERKAIENAIKALERKLANLTNRYADVIELHNDINELGGQLTNDQQIQFSTYATQANALKARIEVEKQKLEITKHE